MRPRLRTREDDLRDLAQGCPPIVDAASGADTGVRLLRWLGMGGMSTVFLAEFDPARRSPAISPLCPARLVLKLNKLSTERQLARLGVRSADLVAKELAALGRVMDRRPPTELVLGLYGSGTVEVDVDEIGPRRLPWLALELVDGGNDGATLTARVLRAAEGVDPVRALRLARGILEGVRVLHEVGVVHRDLKPDNVFVAGPVDDETPKVADCGIARVEGLAAGTVAAMTPAYGAPEQALSAFQATVQNPLIGPWTDVHALAAIVWFLVGGEDWCRGEGDEGWRRGERRTLHLAPRLHPGFAGAEALLGALDEVLRRGASHRLPEEAWSREGAQEYVPYARRLYGRSLFEGPPRFRDVATFGAALLPLLEGCAKQWESRAVRENVAATAFRQTHVLRSEATAPLARVVEVSHRAKLAAVLGAGDDAGWEVDGAVFQPDGRMLVRVGARLVYFVDDRPHKVTVPPDRARLVGATRWLGRGPGGGFALVGPSHVVVVRSGEIREMAPPSRAAEDGSVGEIQAVLADGRAFGVVTAETPDGEGGAELWRSSDGSGWSAPMLVPLGGEVRAVAYGPYGLLVVGARNGRRARALHLRLDGQATVFAQGVNNMPPLVVAMCGATRASWAAGKGFVLRFDGGGAAKEEVEEAGRPVAMALDPVGCPWLVTDRAVLRRDAAGAGAVWRVYYRRGEGEPRLVGLGFTLEGVRVVDARGDGVRLEPWDVGEWRRMPSC